MKTFLIMVGLSFTLSSIAQITIPKLPNQLPKIPKIKVPKIPVIKKPAALTDEEIAAGLKKALEVGTQNAVNLTSQENGFWNDSSIRIPFPAEAQKVKDRALKLGMNKQVEKFELTMNRAAEKAAKEAVSVFVTAITNMTIYDAFSILHGKQNAATEYLEKNTGNELKEKFSPIVQKAIDEVALTQYWNPIAKAYNKSVVLTGGQAVNPDLNAYITEKALVGLFVYVAAEELKIRTQAASRVNDLLKKVFGSLD